MVSSKRRAGALVLESLEHATARGATILAELSGFGASADAHHMTSPAENGAGPLRRCKQHSMTINITRGYGYINAHGTSTPLGDIAETDAIKTVFGAHAGTLAVSSTKSMTARTGCGRRH